MKKIIAVALLSLAFAACSDPKAQEKAALDEVIKIHDKVMGLEEQLMHNQTKLDTLFNEAQNDEAKARITALKTNLEKADSTMSHWMQNFEPAPAGKNHDQLMIYFAQQKKQVIAVDSVFEKAVKESGDYIKPFEKK
ncbi:MAG: hypothetical protein V4619_14950 [Bacteroidota bacterium]